MLSIDYERRRREGCKRILVRVMRRGGERERETREASGHTGGWHTNTPCSADSAAVFQVVEQDAQGVWFPVSHLDSLKVSHLDTRS